MNIQIKEPTDITLMGQPELSDYADMLWEKFHKTKFHTQERCDLRKEYNEAAMEYNKRAGMKALLKIY